MMESRWLVIYQAPPCARWQRTSSKYARRLTGLRAQAVCRLPRSARHTSRLLCSDDLQMLTLGYTARNTDVQCHALFWAHMSPALTVSCLVLGSQHRSAVSDLVLGSHEACVHDLLDGPHGQERQAGQGQQLTQL